MTLARTTTVTLIPRAVTRTSLLTGVVRTAWAIDDDVLASMTDEEI